MRRLILLVVVVLAVFSTVGLASAQTIEARGTGNELAARNFTAHLQGRNETPPNDSLAQGEAIFHLSADGKTLTYKLIAANIDNVEAAHIHIGKKGVAGKIVVWLYPSPTERMGKLIPGRFDGVLAQGTITESDLVGPLADMPLSALIEAMESGDAYVNIHTTAHPAGEIRGQIKAHMD